MVNIKRIRCERTSPLGQIHIIKFDCVDTVYVISSRKGVRISIVRPLIRVQFGIQIIAADLVPVHIRCRHRCNDILRTEVMLGYNDCCLLFCLIVGEFNDRIDRINNKHIRLIFLHLITGAIFVFSRNHIIPITG